MSGAFLWQEQLIPFEQGETLAAALRRAGIDDLGPAGTSLRARIFCGIGACQACVIAKEDGTPVEACLTLAVSGMKVGPVLTRLEHA